MPEDASAGQALFKLFSCRSLKFSMLIWSQFPVFFKFGTIFTPILLKMKLSLTYAVSGIICLPFVNAIGQNLSIAFTGSAGTLKLNGGQILVSANDNWGVQKAAWDLAVDFGRVTGTNLTFAATNATTAAPIYPYRPVTNQVNYTVGDVVNITGPSYTGSRVSLASTVIIAGTIGSSIAIDSLVASGQIDVSAIKGKWESFVTQIVTAPWPGVPRALIIAGSNPRGTIFGVLLSRSCL